MGFSADGLGGALVAVVVSDPVVVGAVVDEAHPTMTNPTHIASDAARTILFMARTLDLESHARGGMECRPALA